MTHLKGFRLPENDFSGVSATQVSGLKIQKGHNC